MATDLAKAAKERGIRYFLISYVDLFGTMRAKLVPAAAIAGMAKSGAGFAGFASWLDMTPADPYILAMPDPDGTAMWEHVYAEAHPVMERERAWFEEYHASFEEAQR